MACEVALKFGKLGASYIYRCNKENCESKKIKDNGECEYSFFGCNNKKEKERGLAEFWKNKKGVK